MSEIQHTEEAGYVLVVVTYATRYRMTQWQCQNLNLYHEAHESAGRLLFFLFPSSVGVHEEIGCYRLLAFGHYIQLLLLGLAFRAEVMSKSSQFMLCQVNSFLSLFLIFFIIFTNRHRLSCGYCDEWIRSKKRCVGIRRMGSWLAGWLAGKGRIGQDGIGQDGR